MDTYTVHFTSTISTAVTVEANSPEDAIELAYDNPKMPGSMCYGAYGDASVDESGEWEPIAVSDADHNEVWSGGA